MKRLTLSLFATGVALFVFGQMSATDPIAHAASLGQPFNNVAALAQSLTAPFQSEADKAEAIFGWIAHHVRYDCKKFHANKPVQIKAHSKEELARKIVEHKRTMAEKTAKHRKGICGDYSELFKALCDEAGLEAVVVTGNARDFYKPFRSAHDNPHAWNAVKIDGEWRLLDATWAAGRTDENVKKFTRRFSPGFFRTPPAWFAQNHFPDDPSWQLLDPPLDKKAFVRQPLINYGQAQFAIEDFSETALVVQGKDYDREIKIKFNQAPAHFMLATQRQKPIKFSHAKEDGYDVIRFSGKGVREVVLFGGKSVHGMHEWIARYDL